MRLVWHGVWRSFLTAGKVFGGFFVMLLLLGIMWPGRVSNWDLASILLGCGAIVGFWGAWKKASIVDALLGVVLAVLAVVVLAYAAATRIVPAPAGELAQGFVYVSVLCAAATAIGYYLGRFLLARMRQRKL